jgi:undecaprenyl-diphosphatase
VDNLIIFCAKYLIFILILAVFVIWLRLTPKLRWQFAAAVVLAGMAALIFSKIAGALYYHPRPFVVQNIKPLIAHGNDNGFPSEHALLAMTLSAVVYYYRRRLADWLFGLTFLIGLGRVFAHVHSPIDILGGLVLGILAGFVGFELAKRLLPSGQKSAVDKQHH